MRAHARSLEGTLAESDVSFEGKTKGENVCGGGVALIYRDCWRASKINIQDKLT